jgi:hypothetical protein
LDTLRAGVDVLDTLRGLMFWTHYLHEGVDVLDTLRATGHTTCDPVFTVFTAVGMIWSGGRQAIR